jgi:hypothetical protein
LASGIAIGAYTGINNINAKLTTVARFLMNL